MMKNLNESSLAAGMTTQATLLCKKLIASNEESLFSGISVQNSFVVNAKSGTL